MFYATGVNFYNVDGTIKSRHAEVDCVQRLKYSNKRKKVNMIVIRTTPTKMLANAKPCCHCIKTVKQTLKKKGYRLHRIYYSDNDGNFRYLI